MTLLTLNRGVYGVYDGCIALRVRIHDMRQHNWFRELWHGWKVSIELDAYIKFKSYQLNKLDTVDSCDYDLDRLSRILDYDHMLAQ
jgi:hypothetical protein